MKRFNGKKFKTVYLLVHTAFDMNFCSGFSLLISKLRISFSSYSVTNDAFDVFRFAISTLGGAKLSAVFEVISLRVVEAVVVVPVLNTL